MARNDNTEDPTAKTLRALNGIIDNEIKQADRQTVRANAKHDKRCKKIAVVPFGETCDWCLQAAGHGFFYKSEASAHAQTHPYCNCAMVPGFKGVTQVEGYDPEALKAEYYAKQDVRKIRGRIREYSKVDRQYSDALAESARFDAELEKMLRSGESDLQVIAAAESRARAARDRVELLGEERIKRGLEIQHQVASVIMGKDGVAFGVPKGKVASRMLGADAKTSARVEQAARLIPTKWLEAMEREGVKVVEGFGYKDSNRSYYDSAIKTVILTKDSDHLDVVHELMHVMDDIDADFFAASEKFFMGRTTGKEKRPLRELDPFGDYQNSEMAFDMGDDCFTPYCYKIYGESASGTYTGFELASMGVEYLWRDPAVFDYDEQLLLFVVLRLKGAK